MGVDAQGHKSPSIDGLESEGRELLDKAGDELVDSVILGGTTATSTTRSRWADDAVALLQENLEQEQHTLRDVAR